MAVQHNKPHDRRGTNPKLDGPYLTDIRAEEEEARRETRQKGRKKAKKKSEPEPTPEEE